MSILELETHEGKKFIDGSRKSVPFRIFLFFSPCDDEVRGSQGLHRLE
jgi:hypothetical protein